MKKYIIILSALCLISFCSQQATAQQSKVGFYFAPEYSAMFLDNHVGRALGYNLGINLLERHLSIGFRYVGRSGPFNEHAEFALELPEGETYKGKSTLMLGADHGYTALEVAYQGFLLDDRLTVKLPLAFGQVGAGFYLKGEDRDTPDGRRVSEWEDDLMGDTDAGFGWGLEGGIALYYQPFKSLPLLSFGGGFHYTRTFGYESFVGGSDFYNNKPRLSFGIMIRN